MSDSLVTVATFGDTVEANLAKNRLESAPASKLSSRTRKPSTWIGYWATRSDGIKLQVGDEDAEAARTLLSQHGDREASAALGPEEIRFESSLAEPTPKLEGVGKTRKRIKKPTNSSRHRPPGTRMPRARSRGAVFGVLFFPLQFYVFYLLLRVFLSDEPLGYRERRKAIIAGIINLPFVVGVCLFVVGVCLILLRSLTQTL